MESNGSSTGINLNEALKILQSKGAEPKKKVIVAVIDGGIDPNHNDFKNLLWTNAKEIAGNGKDDDKNGFADDIAHLGVRVTDDGLLDVYVIDYEPKDFFTDFADFGMIGTDKPVSTMTGFFLNFQMEKVTE